MDNVELNQLRQNVERQIKWYLSDENLQSDTYLRSKMDSLGFVDIKLLSTFKRLKSYTKDIALITNVMKSCDAMFELNADQTKIRPRNDPLRWPIMNNFGAFSNKIPRNFNSIGGRPRFGSRGNGARPGLYRAPHNAPPWMQIGSSSYGLRGPPLRVGYIGVSRPGHPFQFNPNAMEFVPTTRLAQGDCNYASSASDSTFPESLSHLGGGDSGDSLHHCEGIFHRSGGQETASH